MQVFNHNNHYNYLAAISTSVRDTDTLASLVGVPVEGLGRLAGLGEYPGSNGEGTVGRWNARVYRDL